MIRAVCPALISLLFATSLGWAQRPSDADIAALLERSRAKSLGYMRSLPDFVCTEIVNRDTSVNPPSVPRRIPTDTLTVKLSYSNHKEEHKLLLVNDKPTDQPFESLGGAIGTGEFGSTLMSIFEPKAATTFRWERWKNLRKQRVAVYAYTVDLVHSRYEVASIIMGHVHKAPVAFHGELEVDAETGEVLHFTYQADRIPAELELQSVITTVDYDFADVGGHNYLMPAHSTTIIRDRHYTVQSQMEFHDYRKFSADSVIDFGPAK